MATFKEGMIALREKMDTQFDDLLLLRPKVKEVPLRDTLTPYAFEVESLLFGLNKAVLIDTFFYTPEAALSAEQKAFLERRPQSMASSLNHAPQHNQDVLQSRLFTASPFFHLDFSAYVPALFDGALPIEQPIDERLQTNGVGEEAASAQTTPVQTTSVQTAPPKEETIFTPLEELLQTPLPTENMRLGQMLYYELRQAFVAPKACFSSEKAIEKLLTSLVLYLKGQVATAFTSLNALCAESPSDVLSAYVAAHVHYHRVASGQTELLPQARQYAKKASSNAELPTATLYRFRYWCAALDAGFKPERLLDVLRGQELLIPFTDLSEKTREEITLFIKVLALFAQTDADLWTDTDAEALGSVLSKILGGGFLYRALFFNKVAPYLIEDKGTKAHIFEGLKPIHEGVSSVFDELEEITLALNAEKEQTPLAYPWTINQRLMAACREHLMVPQPDAALLNISLDGTQYTQTKLLDHSLVEKNILIGPYWQFWAQQLLPTEGVYMPYNLPYKIADTEHPFLAMFETLLKTLREEENKLLNQERWALMQAHFTAYKYGDVISPGLRQTYSPTIFMPVEPGRKSCYLAWGGEGPPYQRLSQMVEERAKRGGFSSLREVRALFEGAVKLFYDEEYGLIAKQNIAWRRYLAQQQKGVLAEHHKNKQEAALWMKILAETWWFFLLIFPSGVMAFIAVLLAPHLVLTTRIVLLALIGIGFLVAALYALHQARAVKKRMPKLKTVVDKAGNIHMGT